MQSSHALLCFSISFMTAVWLTVSESCCNFQYVIIKHTQATDMFSNEITSRQPFYEHGLTLFLWPLLLTWFNFNPSMDM